MKRTFFLLTLLSFIAAFGCAAVSTSRDVLPGAPSRVSSQSLPYTDEEGRVIFDRMGGLEAEWPAFMSSPKTMAKHADIIAIVKVVKIEKTGWSQSFFITYAAAQCLMVIKGNPPNTFTFSTGGGYMSYEEYIDYYEPPKSKFSYLTEEQKKNAYFLFQADDKNLPEVGGQYLLFLRNTDTDIPAVMGTYQGIFHIEGNQAYQTDAGPAISLDELLNQLTAETKESQ